jgi:ABC-type glycerol-3-phosphate transport system permease component
MMGVSSFSMIPMLLVFVFFQRYFVQGIAGTGMK